MNEKIRELAEQAMEQVSEPIWDEDSGMYYREYGFKLNPEKFAELIVRECAVLVEDYYAEHTYLRADLKIMQHFGVD